MIKCNFTWEFNEQLNCFCLTDHYSELNPTMTLTNNAESVITEICKYDSRIKTLPILYRDSEGVIDEMIPKFSGNICTNVNFKFRGFSNFEQCEW